MFLLYGVSDTGEENDFTQGTDATARAKSPAISPVQKGELSKHQERLEKKALLRETITLIVPIPEEFDYRPH